METVFSKPKCAISVDVDSISSMLEFYKIKVKHEHNYDPIYQKAIPRFLKLLKELDVKATLFIIGADTLNNDNRRIIKQAIEWGHEIANHSLNHALAFKNMSSKDKKDDINKSTDLIGEACGLPPRGFRAPGYDIDEETIDILDKNGYIYDSSVYKFFAYPLMRRISYLKSGHIRRSRIFEGMMSEFFLQVFSPMQAYNPAPGKFWRHGKGRRIVELPMSVVPFFSIPFNTTFLYIFGRRLFDFGIQLIKAKGLDLNYNFHASDMLSLVDDGVPYMKHPGLSMDLDSKKLLIQKILRKISENYDFVTLESLAKKYT